MIEKVLLHHVYFGTSQTIMRNWKMFDQIIKKYYRKIEVKNFGSRDFLPKKRKQEILGTAMSAVNAWKLPQGDYLEFGVWEGRSFAFAYHQAKRYDLDMEFFAFDSFKGLPEIGNDDARTGIFKKGDYSCSEENFTKNMIHSGVNVEDIQIISGFYSDTLKPSLLSELRIKKASIVFIDCDLYPSTRLALEFITDILETGSFLIFDDWFCYGGDPNSGEMKATREWLKKNPHITLVEYKKFGIDGNSFLVNIDNKFSEKKKNT